ncbi:hypothetical protein [Mesorhizobium onobrychidis]|uniref:Uncharacterized protein n=1 Tax=Mesorhizobium onobrychidis TaxID=2775404 RepID=A0ABY5R2E2_9HYPH|nr:hypothetical protein [Mesorhizobium onobrychidis]UVC17448.1 hypothetical protein IHQ72_10185 [Mesorhizobium onobrychidis]
MPPTDTKFHIVEVAEEIFSADFADFIESIGWAKKSRRPILAFPKIRRSRRQPEALVGRGNPQGTRGGGLSGWWA